MPHSDSDVPSVPHVEAWALLDGIADGVILLDSEWRCRYVNDAVEPLVGHSRQTVLGRHVRDLIASPNGDFMHRLLRAAAEQRSALVEWSGPYGTAMTVQIQPRANWTALLFRSASVPSDSKLEIDERLKTRLLHAQKLEVVGRLVGGVAHDFNNLLTVIQSYCAFVAAELPEGSAAHVDMDEVVQAANGAADLTRQLLAFSRREPHQLQRLDVNMTLTHIVRMLRRVLGEDIHIEADFAPTTCSVFADAGQLEQALMNLAVNARDAMPEGGTLKLQTSTVTIDAATAGANSRLAPGRYASIVVEDTGLGMASEVVEKIFEAFYTTKGEGTGLGLAMVLGIVERIGGDVMVESAPGRGSRFTVLLPCLDEPPDEEARRTSRQSAISSPPPRGTETILLVEDELGVRAAIRRMLERLGYTVREAATGAQALDVAATLTMPPDLVLTDVVMPGLNGLALAERLLQQWPSIKLLFMSGYTDDAIRRRGIVIPGGALLEKPLTLELVGHAVRRALDSANSE